MMRKLIATVILATGLAFPGSARADVISYPTSFGVGAFYSEEVAGNFSVVLNDSRLLTLPRFNEPGTLQGVQISFDSTYLTGVFEAGAHDDVNDADFVPFPPFVINDRNDTYIDVTVAGSLLIQLFDPIGSSGTRNLPQFQVDCSANSGGSAVECTIPTTFDNGAWVGTLPIGGIGLGPFVGTDPINLAVLLSGSLSGTCDFDDRSDFCYLSVAGMAWQGSITVSYTYTPAGPTDPPGGGDGDPTPVPEPATMVLMGIGLVAVGARRHRAQRHSPWSTKADQ